LRPPKAAESPNGRRRLCGEAKRADARAGAQSIFKPSGTLGGSENATRQRIGARRVNECEAGAHQGRIGTIRITK